jgi:hypothetical protein
MKKILLKSKSNPKPALESIFNEFYRMLIRRVEQKKAVYLSFNPPLKIKNR